MFRSAKWKTEKNRIKAVFKLQFNATKVRFKQFLSVFFPLLCTISFSDFYLISFLFSGI